MVIDERIVLKDFVVASLELMKLCNCTGAYCFLDGCLAAHLTLQALVFVDSRRATTDEEEQTMVNAMKASSVSGPEEPLSILARDVDRPLP